MYHNKEIINLVPKVHDVYLPFKPSEIMCVYNELGAWMSSDNLTSPILFKIRFGELAVGDKFVFDGCWLVKTGDYSAESYKKRGKTNYLFFKKDVVKRIESISPVDLTAEILPMTEPPGQIFNLKKLISEEETTETIQNSNQVDGADTTPKSPDKNDSIKIIITPNYFPINAHQIEVLEDGHQWCTHFEGDITNHWAVPIFLKGIKLTLIYSQNKIMLCYVDEKTIHSDMAVVWEQFFEKDDWTYANEVIITIHDIKIEGER